MKKSYFQHWYRTYGFYKFWDENITYDYRYLCVFIFNSHEDHSRPGGGTVEAPKIHIDVIVCSQPPKILTHS